MAFSPIGNGALGKYLQIAFSEGVRYQLSRDHRDWQAIQQMNRSIFQGRQLNFLFQNSLGFAAVQSRNPNGAGVFPEAQDASIQEYTAFCKEFDVTINFKYNLLKMLEKSKDVRYADGLAIEIESKALATKRYQAGMLYRDGTGVIGTVASAVDTTGAGGSVLITLSSSNSARGHVGMFEQHDLLLNYNPAGTIDSPTVVGTFYAWRVKSKNRRANQVTLEAVDSSMNVLNLTASSIDLNDVLYRVGQETIPDLTSSISDYGSASEEWAGLETLAANDGRVVHGITMSGANAGTRSDASGDPLDVAQIHALMDDVKIAVGQGTYSYDNMIMAPEAIAALIESRESDRRFVTVDDVTRGGKKFVYQHLDSSLEAISSEYCPKKRLYILPKAKGSNAVLEYHGMDFEPVEVGGADYFLKPSGSGHQRNIAAYMMAFGVLISKHSAAIGVLENFTV